MRYISHDCGANDVINTFLCKAPNQSRRIAFCAPANESIRIRAQTNVARNKIPKHHTVNSTAITSTTNTSTYSTIANIHAIDPVVESKMM
jgi:hypothetical protein